MAGLGSVENAIAFHQSVALPLGVDDLENGFDHALLQILIVLRGLLGHIVVVTGLWVQVLHGWIEALGIWIELGLEVLLQKVVG